jgi:RNA polymerase sigma factor (sigma-70 family)
MTPAPSTQGPSAAAGAGTGREARAVESGDSGARYPLPRALERQLVAAASTGDRAACERLIEAFRPSIAGVARTYRGATAVDREELMQEGVVGLLRAARRYDPRRGVPFWAYASWWVRQAMQQLVAEMTRPVVLSDRALRGLARVKAARANHLQAHGREPSIDELVETTGLPRQQIEGLITIEQTPRALQEPMLGEEGAGSTVEDFMPDPTAEEGYERILQRSEFKYVRDLTQELPERERNILCARYGLGRPAQTLAEIAGPLGVSAERVRQIEEQALKKLRAAAASGVPLSGL